MTSVYRAHREDSFSRRNEEQPIMNDKYYQLNYFCSHNKKKTKTWGTDVERGTISKHPGFGIAGMITPGFRYIWRTFRD